MQIALGQETYLCLGSKVYSNYNITSISFYFLTFFSAVTFLLNNNCNQFKLLSANLTGFTTGTQLERNQMEGEHEKIQLTYFLFVADVMQSNLPGIEIGDKR